MSYRKVFINPYPEGWVDLPNEDTSISAAALQAHTDAIEKMDSYLEKIGKAEDAGYIQMNMFNMSTVYLGKKLGDEGELVDDPGSMTTDFIEIDDKLQYMLSALNDSECLVKVHAYNSDFEWMMLCAMQTFYDNVVFPFAVINGAKYIKVSLSKDAKEVVLEDGYITHPYLPSNKELAAELSEQKESFAQFKDDGYLPRNLFDKNSVILGYYNTDGSTGSDGNWSRTVIKVKPNTPYTISGCSGATSHCFVELDSNQSFISSIVRGNKTITTSANTHYLGISSVSNKALSNHDIDTLQIEEGTEAHSYTPYAMPNTGLTKLVDDAIDGGYIQSKNKLNLIGHGLISQTDGKTISSNSTISYSDYIKLDATKKWVLSSDVSGVSCRYFEYDANKNYLRNSTGASATSSSDAHYIRIQVGDTYLVNAMLEVGTTTKTSYVPYVPSNTELNEILNQLQTVQSLTLANGADYESYVQEVFLRSVHMIGRLAIISISFQAKALQYDNAWKKAFKLPNNLKPIAAITEGTITQGNLPVFLSVDTEGDVKFTFYGKNVPTVSLISANMICII